MRLFRRLLRKSSPRRWRLFVLSLEGTPLGLLTRLGQAGVMPHTARLLDQGPFAPLRPLLPLDSCLNWASFFTGVNPGRHGIFGFLERIADPFEVVLPDARDLKAPSLYEMISRAGRRVGVMNVPMTYPPQELEGFMVAGFLSPDLTTAVNPIELAPKLMELDYHIDADASLASQDLSAFAADAAQTLYRRFAACFRFMQDEDWDFFQLHVSSSDRMNHFFWGHQLGGDDPEGLGEIFAGFYHALDQQIGELLQRLPPACSLALVSEHGFATSKGQVFLNHWLMQNGYLHFGKGKRELPQMLPESRAYSLAPGRVFINCLGRESMGSVDKGKPYQELRRELGHRLGAMRDPESGEAIVKRVYLREELYQGPHLNKAADLVVEPMEGYEFRPNLNSDTLLSREGPGGVHSSEGAFLFLRGQHQLPPEGLSLLDMVPCFLHLLGIAPPQTLDGTEIW